MSRWIVAVFLLLLLLAPARADVKQLKGKVISVREGQAYVELERPVRVKIGARIELVKRSRVASAVIAVSTRWLVVEVPEGFELAKGDEISLTLTVESTPGGQEAAADSRAPVQINRKPIPAEQFQEGGLPEFKKVAFRNRVLPEPGSDLARREPPPVDGDVPRPDAADDEPLDGVLPPANVVTGAFEVGFDTASDDDLGIDRVTPYGRLRFEVRRLGGSDRARLFFYGSVRQPFDGNRDWTGHHSEDLVARISAAVLEIDALPEEQVEGFSDRIELAIGRDTVPGLTAAGVVDGARFGLRFGPVTVYGFGGAGASLNPQREDYDSVIYGGGVRLEDSIPHYGSYYIRLGGAQERFRNEGERDFIEAHAGVRLGSFGIDCQFVLDLFDQLRDKDKVYLSYSGGNLHWQLNNNIRLEVGYREVRPAYQGDLLSADRLNRDVSTDPAVVTAIAIQQGARSDLDPIVSPFVERSVRRTNHAGVVLRFGGTWTFTARATRHFGPDTREAVGGYFALTKDELFTDDRFTIEWSAFHRKKGNGIFRHSTDAFVQGRYNWFGDSVTWGLALFYRTTIPEQLGDSRFGGRVTFEAELAEWLDLYLYGSIESRRLARGSDQVFFSGASLTFNF